MLKLEAFSKTEDKTFSDGISDDGRIIDAILFNISTPLAIDANEIFGVKFLDLTVFEDFFFSVRAVSLLAFFKFSGQL